MYGDYGSQDDWNPMEEAYFNENFNTYETGPGADLDRSFQPCFRKRGDVQRPLCKLYIHRVPRNLTEEGLRNVFLKFGNPRSVYLHKKPTPNNLLWALVEYSSVSEGQEAINALNGRPPLNLSVQFARSEEEKEKMRKESEQEYFFRKMSYKHESAYDLPEMESPYPRAIGRGRGVPMFVSASSVDTFYTNKPYRLYNDELMFRKPIAQGVFSPYRGSVWDPANAHVMDDVSLTVNSTEDGRRISMGRAIPCSELRNRRLPSHKFALRRSESDRNGLQIGLCVFCSEPSLYSCHRCGAWYCSEECQNEDWPMHKNVCMPYLCKKADIPVARKAVSPRAEAASLPVEGKLNKKSIPMRERRFGKKKGEESPSDRLKKGEGRRSEDGRDSRRREEVRSSQKGSEREEARNTQKREDREEARNNQRREEARSSQKRDEARNFNRRDEAKNSQRRQEVMNSQKKEEGRNFDKRESRDDASNGRRGEENNWKRSNVERKNDGSKAAPSLSTPSLPSPSPPTPSLPAPSLSAPTEDDWDEGPSSTAKSPIQAEEKKISSREDSPKIFSKVIRPPENLSAKVIRRPENLSVGPGSPAKSRVQVEEKKVSPSEDSRQISHTVDLSHENFTKVTVGSVLAPGQYWVQLKSEEKDLRSVMNIMKDVEKTCKKATNLKTGDFCSAMFDGFPYRAKVLSVKNDEAEVFFVDFGNVDTCNISDISELPPDAWNYRSQAVKIVMAAQTPKEFLCLLENDIVSVKAISKQKNVRIVQVEGVEYDKILSPLKVPSNVKENTEVESPTSEKVRMQWPKSIIELVKEGMLVVCDVFDVIKGEEDRAILGIAFDDIVQDLYTVFKDFPDACSEMVPDLSFKPKVGDIIAGTTGEEKWLRGVILSEESTGWMVAFCDTGLMSVVTDLRKMPDDVKFREAPAFAIQCKVLKSLIPRKDLFSEERIAISSRLHLKIVSCNKGEVIADMLSKEKELFCKVKLEPWRPEISDLSCQILKSGEKVHIVSYFNTAAMFVQAADDKTQKNIQLLLQEVAGACVGDKGRLKEVPEKGTLVACKFSGDGNHYRALVLDIKEENEVFVSYVDFGNQEWVPLEKVQRLPEALKKIPCYAVKIGLKLPGISQLTPEAVRLLNTLILNTEQLEIVIPDGDLRNCELITKSGDSLNDKIVSLAEPSIKPSSTISDGRIKWSSDMVGKLDIPKGGSLKMKFLILHCPGRCTIVGCPAEDPRISHVYKTFPAEMSEYCEKCPQMPYVPVAYELCLAKFTDGLWYRGFAVDAKGDESQIYFVDFGNWMKVKHKDIRKMVPDFMKVPFIAVLCTYKGLEEETTSKEQENALKQYLKPNTLFFASISQGGPDEYVLDVAEVTEALKSKNLLP